MLNVKAGTSQTILFPAIADHLTTDSAFALAATASSGLPVSYSITSPAGVATLSGGNVLTLTGTPGAVTVKASQAGNGTYEAMEVYCSFTVVDAARRFVKTSSGTSAEHSAGIRADGTLWTWGYNHYGQLGDGTTTQSGAPQQVGTATNWATVACGASHTAAVRGDGTLWVWGDNQYGQLGLGTGAGVAAASSVPVQLGTAATWATVACGESSTLAIRSDGTLWGWGFNSNGELGDGTSSPRREPVQIGTATNWASVSMGGTHTAALRTDGTLWTWGVGFFGALGDGVEERNTPAQVGEEGSAWTQVACGEFHTLAIRSDGTLWACGINFSGQLGMDSGAVPLSLVLNQVSTDTHWRSISAGSEHSVGVRTNGTLWTWGGNVSGELGTASQNYSNYPEQVGAATDWVSAPAGKSHTLALRASGALWSWGNNSHGQLGKGTTDSTATPLQTGADATWTAVARGRRHSVALRADGTLWAWGENYLGQLGDGTQVNRSMPVKIGTATNWTAVACGLNHTLAIRGDGTLWSWGSYADGVLGTGSYVSATSPVQVGTATNWAAIACGDSHCLGLRSDGTLWAWGSNLYGKLGNNGTIGHTSGPARVGTSTSWVKVACGAQHTLALRTDGTLWTWGRNDYGQLGNGTTTDRGTPAQTGTATNWSSMAAGSSHSLAVRTDGSLWAWGYNGAGSLGDGTNTNRLTPALVGSETTWTRVAAGASHSAALRADGSLWTWGSNQVGQLGHGTMVQTSTPARFAGGGSWTQMAAGYDHMLALRADGTLWAAGLIFERPTNFFPARVWPDRPAQTMTFSAPYLVHGETVMLGASASSGLPVTYAVTGPATLGENDRTLLPTAPGLVTLQAQQEGDATWQPATPVTHEVSVQAAPIATLSGNGQAIEWWDFTPTLNNHTDFGNVAIQADSRRHTYTLTNTGSRDLVLGTAYLWGTHATDFSLASVPAASVPPGGSTTFDIIFDPAAPGLRQAGFGIPMHVGEILVSPLIFGIQGTGVSQLINLPPIADHLITDAPFTLGGTSTSGLPLTYTVFSSVPGMATVTNGVLTLSGAPGSVTIVASQPGDGTHGPAPEVRQTFLVMDPQQAFVKLAQGSPGSHGAGIRANGTLWTWGDNSSMQLGHAGSAMAQVGTATNWTAVSCGAIHTVGLRADGTLWSWGHNTFSQLGLGTPSAPQSLPRQIGTGTNWAAVACGNYHTLALQNDGSLWVWGLNWVGQLGDNTSTTRHAPVNIAPGTSWTAIASASDVSMAIRSDGTLWGWGSNNSGQLGDGTYINRSTPVQVGTATNWTAIAPAHSHCAALRADGTLWTWGSNSAGQLGFTGGTERTPQQLGTATDWTHVISENSHSMARRNDGTLWAWGNHWAATLGDGSVENQHRPVQVGGGRSGWSTSFTGTEALRPDGSLWFWGPRESSPAATDAAAISRPGMVGTSLDWATVASNAACTAAVRRDGTLWTWGGTYHGRGSQANQYIPGQVGTATNWTTVACGGTHAAALRADGSLWVWGDNGAGQLGDGSTTDRPEPVQVGKGSHWVAVACGQAHTLALRSDGTLWACGLDDDGQLGRNTWIPFIANSSSSIFSTELVQIGSPHTWTSIGCGSSFSAALRADGTLWAWGANNTGALGQGSYDNQPHTAPVQVGTANDWATFSCGIGHVLATRTDGTLWGWGSNIDGQLGNMTPRFGIPLTQLSTGTDWATVSGGSMHSLATRKDGTLWACGRNSDGQLGDGTVLPSTTFKQVDSSPVWAVISATYYRSSAVRADGSLWTWGSSLYGQLGQWDPTVPARAEPQGGAQTVLSFTLPALSVGVPVTLSASASSGLPLTLTVVGPATLAGNVLTPTGPGTVSVTAYQFGDVAWQPLAPVTLSQTVLAPGISHQQSWRQTHFGTTANSGTAADTIDADHDGLANLIEYAFGLSPVAGGSRELPTPQRTANAFTVSFTEPAGVTGVTYGASYSTSLQGGSWTPIPDTGSGTMHVFSAPIGAGDMKLFIQLSVAVLP